MNPEQYFSFMRESFQPVSRSKKNSFSQEIAGEIEIMIESYLNDAQVFYERGDVVNCFASLAYLHGWLDAGRYLGFLKGPVLCFQDINEDSISPGDSEKLSEKESRYRKMLQSALLSVIPSASTGSPAYSTSGIILKMVRDGFITGTNFESSNKPVSALGMFSYWYGWLDTAVRVGLLKIISNEELFTTEI